jgi:glycosyltransferase involved in cell wall biosynthesis
MHGRLAKSLGAEFQFIDQYKKWNDGEYSKIYLIFAWFFNAFAFRNKKDFQYFLVSGPHFSPVILKKLFLRKDQKLIAHLGDETMYFLYSNWYGSFMKKVLIALLNRYDALFCEGKMAAELAKLNGIDKPIVKVTYLGVPEERMNELQKISPSLKSNHFVFISAGPKGWRTYYKGLDLMLDAYARAFEKDRSMRFTIIGEWDKDVQEDLCKKMTEECKGSIAFVGRQTKIGKYLKDATFYYHTARGDAFPTVVLEAMSAGLIPLVS